MHCIHSNYISADVHLLLAVAFRIRVFALCGLSEHGPRPRDLYSPSVYSRSSTLLLESVTGLLQPSESRSTVAQCVDVYASFWLLCMSTDPSIRSHLSKRSASHCRSKSAERLLRDLFSLHPSPSSPLSIA